MGALDECPYDLELDNEMKFVGGVRRGFEEVHETLAVEEAVKVLLQGLGEDFEREGLRKTPLRVARALREGTRGYMQKVKDIVESALFPETGFVTRVGHAGGAGGLVLVRDLDLFSYCESCLLPFQVKCHIGYVPCGQRVVGLSKLSRVAEVFAKRLQDPYRLADDICSALQNGIKPAGAAVILKCHHIHFPNLGSAAFRNSNHNGWVTILVKSGSGVFLDKSAEAWSEFLSLLRFKEVEDIYSTCSDKNKSWCPCRTFCKMGEPDPSMLRAVSSILGSIGEDPLRKELVETPACFINWMMNFKSCDLDLKLNEYPRMKMDSKILNRDSVQSEMSLPFWSQCEHHLLPFYGIVHIGYFVSEHYGSNPVGKSLLQSVVHFYGFKLQVQERLTRQIAETVSLFLGEDVIVVVEASHTCMMSRGIEKLCTTTATIALLGRFSTDSSARAKFLQMIPSSGSA